MKALNSAKGDLQGRIVGAVRRELARLRSDPARETEALVRRLKWRIARRLTPVIAVDTDGVRLFVSTADQTLSKGLFCYPDVRQQDAQLAFAVVRSLPLGAERLEGGTVLEIGANIGSHTVEFLTHYGAGHVVAIEPDPGNFALLTHNVVENGLADRATILQLAVSDSDGRVELELSPDNAGDHRVRVSEIAERERAAVTVEAASVDSLAERGKLDLDAVALVWMDVQGHEAHVLRGARRLLGSDVPIVMEYWPGGLRRSGTLDAVHQLIAEHYSYVIDLDTRGHGRPQVVGADDLPALERLRGWDDGRLIEPSTDLVLARDITPDWQLGRR